MQEPPTDKRGAIDQQGAHWRQRPPTNSSGQFLVDRQSPPRSRSLTVLAKGAAVATVTSWMQGMVGSQHLSCHRGFPLPRKEFDGARAQPPHPPPGIDWLATTPAPAAPGSPTHSLANNALPLPLSSSVAASSPRKCCRLLRSLLQSPSSRLHRSRRFNYPRLSLPMTSRKRQPPSRRSRGECWYWRGSSFFCLSTLSNTTTGEVYKRASISEALCSFGAVAAPTATATSSPHRQSTGRIGPNLAPDLSRSEKQAN